MRNYIYCLPLALAALFTLASCSKEKDMASEQREIKFTASMGSFQVKATDTAFEAGDAIGVFALGTTYFENAKMTADGASLIPETPVYWSTYQKVNERTLFRAYYPYQDNLTVKDKYTFTVKPDQSTHALYTASDLMIGDAFAAPGDETVHLNFIHQLSKVIVTIDNRLEGEIADVYFGNVQGRAQVVFTENFFYTQGIDDAGTIKSGKVTLADGTPAWALVIAPQYTKPQLMITTTDGKQYTYNSDSYVSFISGRRYHVSIILDESSIATDFTSDVIDWTDDSDIQFGQETQQGGNESWSLIGSIQGTSWDTDFPLDLCYADGDYKVYYGLFYYNEGDQFKLRKDNNWEVNAGAEIYDVGSYTVEQGGANMALAQSGIYELFFVPSNNYLHIAPAGQNNTWSLIGTLNGTNWDTDFLTGFYALFNEEEKGYDTLITTQIDYHEGEEFKFRYSGSWDLNYGVGSDANVVSGVWNSLLRDGQNILIGEGDGVYAIDFYWNERVLSVTRLGDLPQEIKAENISEVLNGRDRDIFTVKGTVTRIANTSYGNYYIADGSGELYIYGTVDADGKYPQAVNNRWYNDSFNLVPGDVVTVKGPKTTYNGTVELVDVVLEQVERCPLGTLSSNSLTVSATGGTVNFNSIRSSSDCTVTCDATWVTGLSKNTVNDSWFDISATVQPNEREERTATITVTNASGSLEFTVTQKAPRTTGTATNPFNIAEAIAYIDEGGTEDVYVKGIVSEIVYEFTANYGTATFWISDDGVNYGIASNKKSTTQPTKDFECYGVYWLGNKSWAEGNDQVKIGDEVIVCGQLTKYNNSIYETASKKAYIYSLNGKTE